MDPVDHQSSDAALHRKNRNQEKRDDATVFAELISDEIPVVGQAKRLFGILKRKFSQEYIARIEYLENRHEEMLRTQSLLTRTAEANLADLKNVKSELSARNVEIAELKKQLRSN